nr:MAG TPA: hypothetical protein [Caudoviricetes sp.]
MKNGQPINTEVIHLASRHCAVTLSKISFLHQQ